MPYYHHHPNINPTPHPPPCRCAQGLAEASHRHHGDVPEVRSSVREVEGKLDASVANIRNDVKHAIALCSATTKSELLSDVSARNKELERRLAGRLAGAHHAAPATQLLRACVPASCLVSPLHRHRHPFRRTSLPSELCLRLVLTHYRRVHPHLQTWSR